MSIRAHSFRLSETNTRLDINMIPVIINVVLLVCAFVLPIVQGKEIVRLCGCPLSSACPGNCATFELDGECQPFYQCFLERNGLFGYTKPVRVTSTTGTNGDVGEILVPIYDDKN